MIKDGRLTHVCRPSRTLLIGVAASLCMIGATPALTVAAEPNSIQICNRQAQYRCHLGR